MFSNQLHYLPLSPLFFSILAGVLLGLFFLIQVGALRYAYMRLGLGSGAALALLLGSLIGSYFRPRDHILWHALHRADSCRLARNCYRSQRWGRPDPRSDVPLLVGQESF